MLVLLLANLALSIILLWPLPRKEERELQQENVWYPTGDGVYEHRFTLFLSADSKWVKEFEHRKIKKNEHADHV
jgi:isocitrate dehydrogenase kinase/phosphatase